MNVRKPADYSALYAALDTLMAANLPQMELYCEIGRLVNGRQEKGAAVAAAEYLHSAYPDVSGFSPRNLRRMRDFYRTYEDAPEIMAEAMAIGWTQNVVILEVELALQERAWYIRAVRQFDWSKLELSRKIQEHTHETIALDNTEGLCYSNDSRGDENGEKETSRAFLQGLRDEKVQREFQRQGPCGAYLQSLFPTLTRAACRANDAPPPGEPAASSFDRERNDVAEKSNPRSPARGESIGLHSLFRAISPTDAKSKEAGAVHPGIGAECRWRRLRSLWRPGTYQRELPSQPDTADHRPHSERWCVPDNRTPAQRPGEAVEMDRTYAGNFLVGRGLLRSCRY